jgi:regulator of ribosome biosynthesis
MPRSKRLPEDRVLTKWEKFAKEKGIKKRKKTGLKYDPTLKKQVAQWGARSKNN